ncbi:hypothetical protein ABZ357_17020 [Streptomyces sp. NPDC005917]
MVWDATRADGVALIGVSLPLCFTLDRPFSGELSVSPEPFEEGVLARFFE